MSAPKQKNYTIVIKKNLRYTEIEDILESAFVGCTYWADELSCGLQLIKPEDDVEFSQALTRGYYILIHDKIGNKWEKLTLHKLLKALKKTPTFDYDNYDSLDAERVLQKALFGKLVYA